MNFDSKIVVIDNGTGYTKMGYAGNTEPAFDIPTLIAETGTPNRNTSWIGSNKKTCDTLEFCIGDDARSLYRSHKVLNPIEGGIVRDWDLMEKFWHRSIFDYLRCDPEETVFVLTEPPMNPPDNREHVAEIMFETFNVKGLYIGVQAVFALISSSGIAENVSYTGTVLDSGDGVTHIIPVVDGFVISSCIKHIPLAGSNMTTFTANMLRDRNEKCPVEDVSRIAKMIKEKYGYVVESGDLLGELTKFDNRLKNDKLRKKFDKYIDGIDPVTNTKYSVAVGPERFLAPEMFFNPEIVDERYRASVDELIDKVVQLCPISVRRQLYANIALSGGSTLFKGFKERLHNGVQRRVDERLKKYEMKSHTKVSSGVSIVDADRGERAGQPVPEIRGVAGRVDDVGKCRFRERLPHEGRVLREGFGHLQVQRGLLQVIL